MNPGLGIGALVLAGAAAASLVVVSTVPVLHAITQFVGIDQPISSDVVYYDDISPRDYPIAVHASAAAKVLEMRIAFTREGASDGAKSTTAITNTRIGVHELATGTVDWMPDASGDFTMTPSFRTQFGWFHGATISVDVANGPGVYAPGSAPTPSPTLAPAVPETAAPQPPAAAAPAAPPAAAPAPPVAPAPAPTTAAAVPAPSAGTISRRANGQNDLLTAQGFTPVNATVDIQYQISVTGSPVRPSGTWTSLGCGTVMTNAGNNYCQVNHNFPQTGTAQTVYPRVVVTFGGQQSIAYGNSWVIAAAVH